MRRAVRTVLILVVALAGCFLGVWVGSSRHATTTPSAVPPATHEHAASPRADAPQGFDLVAIQAGPTQEKAQVVAARGDPAHVAFKVSVSPRQRSDWLTAAEIARRDHALAAINGGYFDDRDRPLGLLIADGRTANPLRKADWGVFFVKSDEPAIVHTRNWRSARGVEQALQCGPRLVVDGEPSKLKPSITEARSAVGIDSQGRVVFAVTRNGGLSLSEFAAVLARPLDSGGLGCKVAMNLDGGPSSQLAVPNRLDIPGAYGMPSHLVMMRRGDAS